MTSNDAAVTILGLGAMGRALATTMVDAGYATTLWNRSPGKAGTLVDRGAVVADTVGDAVTASRVVVVCLLDHDSVHRVLYPVASHLRGRDLVNLTTTTPAQSRELAGWTTDRGIACLDGAIMAIPQMIGQPGSILLYSGDAAVFERHKPLLARWGDSSYVGSDAGRASLWDLAMLSGMYVMLAGFVHGAAMVGSEGVTASEFATRATPFLAAMTGAFAATAEVVDSGDYAGEDQQSLEFTGLALRHILQASVDQGVEAGVLKSVHELIQRQITAGHGKDAFERIYEEFRRGVR